ncbi:MAG: hypothetical protein Aurels2KO_21970 [Aureliella sp.]
MPDALHLRNRKGRSQTNTSGLLTKPNSYGNGGKRSANFAGMSAATVSHAGRSAKLSFLPQATEEVIEQFEVDPQHRETYLRLSSEKSQFTRREIAAVIYAYCARLRCKQEILADYGFRACRPDFVNTAEVRDLLYTTFNPPWHAILVEKFQNGNYRFTVFNTAKT